MSFENYQVNKKNENDECNIHGICSISPTASAIKSAIFAHLQELAFYVLKVRDFGARNNQIKNSFIEIFSTLIPNYEYTQENLNHILPTLQGFIVDVKNMYKQLCEEKNIEANFFKNQMKLGEKYTISDVVKQGQKYNDKINSKLSEDQKKGLEIIIIILKSICLYIVELQSLDVDIDKYYEELLLAINPKNFNELSTEEIKELMKKYSLTDNELMSIVFEARKKEFGEFIETDILLSPKEGKAILVAGTDLHDLKLLLEATKDKGINIYTHGRMITGHTFEKLKTYPHLMGHYGKGIDDYISDFSSFPGAILLTKMSLFRVEKLCFCKLYTTDKITNLNATPIKDNDFEPIIHSALREDGFEETEPEIKEKFGINEQNYINEVAQLVERVSKNEIKNIFTIGVSNKIDSQIEYFKRFLKLLNKDCFAISFNYKDGLKNILYNNIDYAFPYLYKALDALLKVKQASGLKIYILNSRCEPHTIPNMIHLKTLGVDKIYFYPCQSSQMNPTLTDLLLKLFDMSEYTTPENDFKKSLNL